MRSRSSSVTRVADGDDVAPGGQCREGCPERFHPAPDRGERNLLARYPAVGQDLDEVGIRVAVVAPPDFGFFEAACRPQDAALFGRSAGGGEGRCQNPKRRARTGAQGFDRRYRSAAGWPRSVESIS